MSVRRIGSDGDVDSDGCRMAVGLAQKAGGAISRIGDFVEMQAQRFPESSVTFERAIHFAASFFGGAEAAIGQNGFDVLASLAGDGDFEVVNGGSAVQSESGRVAAGHEIDKNRREAALDDVTAEAPHDRLFAIARGYERVN